MGFCPYRFHERSVVAMTKARKTFAEYAAERAKQASAEEAEAVRVFDEVYAKHSVGVTLALARKARRLNQTELARRAGLDQGDLSRIERGITAPTAPPRLKLVEALGGQLTLTVPAEAEAGAKIDAEGEPLSLVMG
jgi:ribosome-binding protein aMBF1 (putative translation factor)